jgi:hypothetical protein
MKVSTNLLLLTLLIAALNSQSASLGNATYYTVQNQTYLYVYGTGSESQNALGNRTASTVQAGSQTTFTATATGPTPVQITCPYNQVYDNILCQCVCIIGYHF